MLHRVQRAGCAFLRFGFVLSACLLLHAPAARSQVAYGIDTPGDRLVRIDLSTGVATVVGSLGVDVTAAGMDFDDAGNLWAMLTVASTPGTGLYNVDLNTAAVSFVVATDRNIGGRGCAFVASTLYHTDGSTLGSVDTSTGVTTIIGAMGFNAPSLASTPGGSLFCLKSNPAELASVDPSTGAGSVTGPTSGAASNLAFDPVSEQLFSVSGDDRLYRIDPATGNATEIGPLGISGAIAGLAVYSGTVPVTERTWSAVKSEYRE
jgi:hypothetical protein